MPRIPPAFGGVRVFGARIQQVAVLECRIILLLLHLLTFSGQCVVGWSLGWTVSRSAGWTYDWSACRLLPLTACQRHLPRAFGTPDLV